MSNLRKLRNICNMIEVILDSLENWMNYIKNSYKKINTIFWYDFKWNSKNNIYNIIGDIPTALKMDRHTDKITWYYL